MRRPTWLTASLLAAAAAGSFGCKTEDPESCEYWVKRLNNPAKVKEALLQVGEMKCPAAVDPLKKMFDDGLYQEEALRAVKNIGDAAAATQLATQALNIKELGPFAASIIGDMELKDGKKALEDILTGTRNPSARQAALEALLKLAKPEEIQDALIAVAIDDPTIQGIRVNATAIEKLGDARSEKAVPALTRALFLKDANNIEVYAPARMAFAKIGPPAVPHLLEVLKGEDEEFNAWAKNQSIPKWEWQEGPKIVQILGDLRDKSATGAIAENFARDLAPIEGLSEKLQERWIQNQTNRLVMAMIALGQIGDDSYVDVAEKVIPNQPDRDTTQRLNFATSLAFVGTETAVSSLFKFYVAEQDYRFKAPLLVPLSMALDEARLPDWNRETVEYIVPKDPKKPEEISGQQYLVKEQLDGDQVPKFVQPVTDCRSDGKCYAGLLDTSDNMFVKQKAALMLSRKLLPEDETFKILAAAFEKAAPDETDLRRFILMGIGKVAKARHAVELDRLIKLFKDKKNEAFWVDELTILKLWVERQTS